MTLAQVRKPPHVPQPNAEAHAGQDVLGFVVPLLPPAGLFLLNPVQVLMVRNPEIQSWVREHQSHGVTLCGLRERGTVRAAAVVVVVVAAAGVGVDVLKGLWSAWLSYNIRAQITL